MYFAAQSSQCPNRAISLWRPGLGAFGHPFGPRRGADSLVSAGQEVGSIRQLHEIQPPVERALLVGAPRRGTRDALHSDDHLDELGRLADTAGAEVVGRLVQRIQSPTPNLYLGEGKVEELRVMAEEARASLLLFDEELSPVQGKNLEAVLKLRVMDRAELILDIFATRARSKEAKLQVELAQLEYLLPRLARMWVHLSRIRGGIGLRGPGETQIETDRRMIRRKISHLREQLADVERHRAVLRQGRERRGVKTAALVGYTNAGKSSLLRALTGSDTFIEDRLFATLDTLARDAHVGDGRRMRVVDTVGFIRKLPHNLVASFRATLEEAGEADVILHVIDAAHPQWEEHVAVVDEVLADLGLPVGNVVHVFNKMDLVKDAHALRDRVRATYAPAACVSAVRGEVGEVVEALARVGTGGSVARTVPEANRLPRLT
jgi:GTP-binding protein HflX